MSEIALDQQALANLSSPENQEVSPPTVQTPSTAEEAKTPGPVSSNPIVRFVEQPAVKRSMPAVIGVFALILCTIFYLWISAPGHRAVYPGMIETDRQAAYDLLLSAG